MSTLKVVFMGTPEFSVTILDTILHAGYDVAGVVTTPDKPAGRGQHLSQSAVKQFALAHQLPVWQPENLKEPVFIRQLTELHADVFVVVAFRMLPEAVYTIPTHGTFNVHASLLPQYRGAAPIQRAIMNGETKTGVTTFFLDRHTDTGDIIGQKEVPITHDDTGETLHDKLMLAGADLAVETLQAIEQKTVHPVKQPLSNPDALQKAPKIFKEDMLIHWDDTAENIYNKIRGLSPYPAAYTRIRMTKNNPTDPDQIRTIKILKCHLTNENNSEKPGTIQLSKDNKMVICTQNTTISIDFLQFEGKKQMDIENFLKGFRFDNYTLILF